MDGQIIKATIEAYLQKLSRGEVELPTELIDEYTQGLNDKFKTRRERSNHGEFTLRLSNLGRPTCQLQRERDGAQKREVHENLMPVRFATGEMLEHWLLMIIKASGLKVEGVAIPTDLEVYGETIQGEVDIVINGVVYDIKSASAFSFRKFSEGFDAIYQDDPFGYVVQGYNYAAAIDKPFGGWIVINKNNGEICVCDTPINSEKYAEEAAGRGENAVATIMDDRPFERQFSDVEETYRKKPTGNRKLIFTCAWCPYKYECWDNLTYAPQAMSTAVSPKWEYYTELNYTKDDPNDSEAS